MENRNCHAPVRGTQSEEIFQQPPQNAPSQGARNLLVGSYQVTRAARTQQWPDPLSIYLDASSSEDEVSAGTGGIKRAYTIL